MPLNINNKIFAFSLLELIVTIAIIALLTTVATPIYTSYTIKSKISSVFPILEGFKNQINEYYATKGSFPADVNALNSSIYTDTLGTANIFNAGSCQSITNSFGCIRFSFASTSQVPSQLQGKILSLIAVENGNTIQWICKTGDNSNQYTIDTSLLPKSCQ